MGPGAFARLTGHGTGGTPTAECSIWDMVTTGVHPQEYPGDRPREGAPHQLHTSPSTPKPPHMPSLDAAPKGRDSRVSIEG